MLDWLHELHAQNEWAPLVLCVGAATAITMLTALIYNVWQDRKQNN